MSPVEAVAILLYFASWSVLPLCLGIFMSNRNRAVNYSVYIALAAHVAVNLPEGGPGLCIGAVFVPFVAAVICSIGALIRRGLIWAGWIKAPPPLMPPCDV